MIDQNWWFDPPDEAVQVLSSPRRVHQMRRADRGRGFSAGSAAAEFLQKGFNVVLIDRNMVGGSSSGRSAGFLTPTPNWNCINWSAGSARTQPAKSGRCHAAASSASSRPSHPPCKKNLFAGSSQLPPSGQLKDL